MNLMGPNPGFFTHSHGAVRLADAAQLTGLDLPQIQPVSEALQLPSQTGLRRSLRLAVEMLRQALLVSPVGRAKEPR